MPLCKAPRVNSDDNNYDVVHIGTHRIPYPIWKSPQTNRDPTMRLLPNENIFRFPDNTIFHFCKGCRGPGLNNFGVWRTHSTNNCQRLKETKLKEAQDRDNNKRPYHQDQRQNKRNRDDQQHRGYIPRK